MTHQLHRASLLFCILASALALCGCDTKPAGEKIFRAPASDPRLVAATAEAQRRWPEFVAAFKKHDLSMAYEVKLPFGVDGGRTEYMWVNVVELKGDTIIGLLDNTPEGKSSLKIGDKVEASVSEVQDWMFSKGTDMTGCFSVPVLEQMEKEARGK